MIIFTEARVKEVVANQEVQKAIQKMVEIPKKVMIKSIRNRYKNDDTNETSQKIHAVSGTSLKDMVEVDFTLVNHSEISQDAINKEYQIVEYSLNLEANMRGGNFNGYSPTGLKLLVTKLTEVKDTVNKNETN